MIGIIEKVLVDCLLSVGGDELKLDAFLHAGIRNDRVYRLDRHYPDDETGRLLTAALHVTGLEIDALFEVFSVYFLDVVEAVFPKFLEMAANSEELVRMQAKIHALIAAGIRSPEGSSETNDKFKLDVVEDHHFHVTYKSELQLCALYKILVRFTADRFGDEIDIEELGCRHKGASSCQFSIKWLAIDGVPTVHGQVQKLSVASSG